MLERVQFQALKSRKRARTLRRVLKQKVILRPRANPNKTTHYLDEEPCNVDVPPRVNKLELSLDEFGVADEGLPAGNYYGGFRGIWRPIEVFKDQTLQSIQIMMLSVQIRPWFDVWQD